MTFTDPQHAIFTAMAGPMATKLDTRFHTSPPMRRPTREDAR